MKRIILGLLLGLTLTAPLSADPAGMTIAQAKEHIYTKVMNPAKALDVVRKWEGKPNLNFTRVELTAELQYELEAAKPHRSWSVDPKSAFVWGYWLGQSGKKSSKPHGPLTKAQCRKIAEEFAAARYPDFTVMGFDLAISDWSDTAWLFQWEQKVAYGAITDNSILIDVSPSLRQITSYNVIHVPTPHPREPSITMEKASEIARLEFTRKGVKLPNSIAMDSILLTVESDGSVHWTIDKYGRLKPGGSLDWTADKSLRMEPSDSVDWTVGLPGEPEKWQWVVIGTMINAETGDVENFGADMGAPPEPEPTAKTTSRPHRRHTKRAVSHRSR